MLPVGMPNPKNPTAKPIKPIQFNIPRMDLNFLEVLFQRKDREKVVDYFE